MLSHHSETLIMERRKVRAVEFVKGQVEALRSMVERPQTQAFPASKPSNLLPSKKRKYMSIKEEAPSSEQVILWELC